LVYLDLDSAGSFLYYQDNEHKGTEFQETSDLVLTTNTDVVEMCRKHKMSSLLLTDYLGLTRNLSLYEIFSYYFEGKIQTDFDMLEAIFNGLINQSDWCF
jgi:hypothetical protein